MPMPTRRLSAHLAHRRRALRHAIRLGLVALTLVHGGCSNTPGLISSTSTSTSTSTSAAGWRAAPGQTLLLGELHDNAALHALRARGLAALLAQGDRPALLMEQFDREQQPALDALQTPGHIPTGSALQAQVDALLAVGGPGWHWPFYRPVLALAVAHGLPVVAANLSRADARRVAQLGLAATGWRADVPADLRQAQTAAIAAGHCGQLDDASAARLALAQVARDQAMAQLLTRYAPRGAVLLAGNGHVRADIGVPRWLDAGLRARTRVVGLLETTSDGASTTAASAYDAVLRGPAQPRPDPCADLQMPVVPVVPAVPAVPNRPASP